MLSPVPSFIGLSNERDRKQKKILKNKFFTREKSQRWSNDFLKALL